MNNGPTLALRIVLAMMLAITAVAVRSPALAQSSAPKALAAIPPDKDTDLKFYSGKGPPQEGVAALEHMMSDADLVLWVAGNQFFAMDEVVGAFQKAYPGVTVGLITLPPGLLLSAIEGGGWIYNGKEYRGRSRYLCVRQSWPPEKAQGGRPHEQLRNLHA